MFVMNSFDNEEFFPLFGVLLTFTSCKQLENIVVVVFGKILYTTHIFVICFLTMNLLEPHSSNNKQYPFSFFFFFAAVFGCVCSLLVTNTILDQGFQSY